MLPYLPSSRAALLRSTVASWIPRGSDVAIIDVPVHRNIGDLFIYAIADWLLGDLGCSIVYRAGVRDFRTSTARRRIGRETVLVGLGGGNFGDLYPRYQTLRERVAADFPQQRMVVLPQSIHYTRDEARAASVAALRRHADLRIGARDAPSLATAREISAHAVLLPDVVHALGAATLNVWAPDNANDVRGGSGTLFLLRQDGERVAAQLPAHVHELNGRSTRADWLDLVSGVSLRVAGAALTMPVVPADVSVRLHQQWREYAISLFTHTVSRLRRFDHVVTDRLHGAILARLAGCPVTLVDNSYGKLAAYYDAWWMGDPGLTIVRSPRSET